MTIFNTTDGFVLVDEEPLGRGGRGKVFPVLYWSGAPEKLEGVEVVCKLVERRHRSEGRQAKLRWLERAAERAPRDLRVAWPLTSVFDEEGEWVGYLMRRVRGEGLGERRLDTAFSAAQKVDLARQMCHLVRGLHRMGLVVGDLNLANFLFDSETKKLHLIDLDSAQVVDDEAGCVYPTIESREKSPEMLAGTLGETTLSSRSDDYLLAVEVFRLLFGVHPLDEYRVDVSPAEVRAENAMARRFGYECEGIGCGADAFGAELGALFRRSFSGPYEDVPSAAAYERALSRLGNAAAFAQCARCGQEHVAHASREEEACAHERSAFGNMPAVMGALDAAARRSVSRETLGRAGVVLSKSMQGAFGLVVATMLVGACAHAPELAHAALAWTGDACAGASGFAEQALAEAAAACEMLAFDAQAFGEQVCESAALEVSTLLSDLTAWGQTALDEAAYLGQWLLDEISCGVGDGLASLGAWVEREVPAFLDSLFA